MLYFTYEQQGGRSGHSLLEILMPFVMTFLIEGKVVYNSSWTNQSIISKESFLHHTSEPPSKYDYIHVISKYKKWEGISFEDLTDILNEIKVLQTKKYQNILVKFTNVCKILFHMTHKWFEEGKIKQNIYTENIIPLFQQLYYYDHDKTLIDRIAIHIRAGDLTDYNTKYGLGYEYYENIVNKINQKYNYGIDIYIENNRYQLFENLKHLRNVTFHIGGTDKLKSDFNQLCRSKYLIMSPSSFALFAGYFSVGTVVCDMYFKEVRINLFHDIDNIFMNLSEFLS